MADSLNGPAPLAGAPDELRAAVLRLNQDHVVELSDLDEMALKRLVDTAFYASAFDDGDAFLIAFDQDAEYDSPNFRWFQERYQHFVYVDRVVVAGPARGRGLATQLYDDLFGFAAASGHSLVACEVNIDPPNPASDAFHHRAGFEEVGRGELASGKTVRYLIKRLR